MDPESESDKVKKTQMTHREQLKIGISCMTYEIWMTCVCMNYNSMVDKILKMLKLVSVLHNNNIPLHFYVNKFTLLNQLDKNLNELRVLKYAEYDRICSELIQLHIVSYQLNVNFEPININPRNIDNKRPLIKIYDTINYIIRNDQSNTYLNIFFNNLSTILLLLTDL